MSKLVHYIVISFVSLMLSLTAAARTVVVIDAGHGGKDPGAIGKTLGLQEKAVTLSISKELKALLDADPNFKAVMTRKSDYFIQLPERTEIARKNRANYLVSIHADSSPNSSSLKGTSVWVLSNRRANDEMGKWLEDNEKQSELLGGAGSVLSHTREKYLNQTVLDLQFSHAQRAGYELGKTVLARLANVAPLAKSSPQHASLSVLRSPDITSILVETGFLSNPTEEQKLANPAYRRQIARAIYNGLVAYRAKNLSISESRKGTNYKAAKKDDELKSAEKEEKKSAKTDKKAEEKNAKSSEKSTANTKKQADKKRQESAKSSEKENKDKSDKSNAKVDKKSEQKAEKTDNRYQKSTNGYHVVQQDETLYRIALLYGTTPEKISEMNNIKNNKITVGKKLKVK